MKSVRTEGCHVGLFFREFVGTACCTYGQSNTTSDFHNLTGIVTRAIAPQSESRVLTYRSMKHFQHNEFTKDVGFVPFHVCEIFDEVDDILLAQQQLFSSIINTHAPLKRRRIRRRQVPYMNGPLRKITHQRNMWRNRHLKDKRNTTPDRNISSLGIRPRS